MMQFDEHDMIEINLRGSVIPHYLVWQYLFTLYREQGGDLDHMWDMLCDLTIIENVFKRAETAFYWEVTRNYTNITTFRDCRGDVLETPDFSGDLYLVCIDYENKKAILSKESA